MRPVVKPLLAVVVALAVMTACSDDNPETADSSPETTAANPGDTESPATTAAHESDGVLRIGVLLPQTGEGAAIGSPAAAGANYAVNLINQAGGVLGEPVGIETADEGQSMDQAEAAVAELLAADVDAVVGPASSITALEFLDDLVGNDVLTCSPTATSMALDHFPDDGLFFRTVPSDSSAAVAIAYHAKRTGVNTATVVYVDDAFGRPFARAVIEDLRRRQMEVLADIPLESGAVSYADEIELLTDAEATGTIILIANSSDGWNFLSQLSEQMPNPPTIVVNDALRRPPAAEMVVALRRRVPRSDRRLFADGPARAGHPTSGSVCLAGLRLREPDRARIVERRERRPGRDRGRDPGDRRRRHRLLDVHGLRRQDRPRPQLSGPVGIARTDR